MNSNTINKLMGYTLLVIGLLLIVVPLYQTYNIFVGKSLPPDVFKSQKIILPNQNLLPQTDSKPLDLQQQLQTAMKNILPIDLINNTLNLVSWLILMWILIFGGSKITDIGIK